MTSQNNYQPRDVVAREPYHERRDSVITTAEHVSKDPSFGGWPESAFAHKKEMPFEGGSVLYYLSPPKKRSGRSKATVPPPVLTAIRPWFKEEETPASATSKKDKFPRSTNDASQESCDGQEGPEISVEPPTPSCASFETTQMRAYTHGPFRSNGKVIWTRETRRSCLRKNCGECKNRNLRDSSIPKRSNSLIVSMPID
ncbi:MAG: hypothetical protein M1820_009033 [Bogoriella megaspora]|nr:MAG: hypothetical protein M1820_009033 [Bogoriella megaspora]